jgi:hypothetical protein
MKKINKAKGEYRGRSGKRVEGVQKLTCYFLSALILHLYLSWKPVAASLDHRDGEQAATRRRTCAAASCLDNGCAKEAKKKKRKVCRS